MRSRGRPFSSLLLAVVAVAPSLRADVLVLDDALQGATKGTRSGGEFVAGGWKVTGVYDSIYWHVPTVTTGAVEWDVRGLAPAECRAGLEDKSELFHMYDWEFGDSDTNYNGGYRDNPCKHFVRKIDCNGGTVNAMELVWKIADTYEEPDTPVLSWNASTTYRFREEWEPQGANSVFRTYRDGVLLSTTTLPGLYAPVGHGVRIAASTRRAGDAGAPLDAVFSNVKVWDRSQKLPGAPAVTAPLTAETVRTACAFVAWSGDASTRYRVRIATTNDTDGTPAWDSGDVDANRTFAWTGALPDAPRYYVFVRLGNALGWGPWSARGRSFVVDTAPAPSAGGPVKVLGNSVADAAGPFLGLGVTYMQALRRCKYDRVRLGRDLAFLAERGFNYVRVLSMVGWYPYWEGLEIAPVAFTNQRGQAIAAWPDYWQQLVDLVDLVASAGMRTQITIFADAQLMPAKSARVQHMDTLLARFAGREGKIVLLEVGNEAWQNGFPGSEGVADLREFGAYLAARTSIPIALSATAGATDATLAEMYRGSAADIATEHFSRDIGTAEGGWLPVRDCWRVGNLAWLPPASSNEPIGPGSSVNSENDPIKLVSAAVFAYVAGLPLYVFHSSAGVRGLEPFEAMAGVGDFANLRKVLPPDMPGWVRNGGLESAAAFRVFCDDQADRYWPDVAGAKRGCVRACGARKGEEFVAFPMGIIEGGLELEPHRPMQFQVIDPRSGAVVYDMARNAGERFLLAKGPGAYIIRGKHVDAVPRKTLEAKPVGRSMLIDGDPEDWDLGAFTLPVRGGQTGTGDHAFVGYESDALFYGGVWTGGVLPESAEDHGAAAFVRHDDEALYFLVRCDDSDIRVPNAVDMNWANDCVEIYLDPSGNRGGAPLDASTSDVQLVIDAANRKNVYMCTAAYGAHVLGGVDSAVAADGDGWWLELRIEKDTLAPRVPAAGSMGLDFNFRDNDAQNDPARTTVYTWSDSVSSAGFPSKIPDRWAQLVLPDPALAGALRVPNDCNRDAALNIGDAICLLQHLFGHAPLALACGDESADNPAATALLDCNADGGVDIGDAICLLGFLFAHGPEPRNGGPDVCLAFAGCVGDACP